MILVAWFKSCSRWLLVSFVCLHLVYTANKTRTTTCPLTAICSQNECSNFYNLHKFPWPPPHWHFRHHRYLFKVMNTATLTQHGLVSKSVWAHQLNRKSSYLKFSVLENVNWSTPWNEFNTCFYSPGQGFQPNSLLEHSKINFKKNQEWTWTVWSDKAKIPIFYWLFLNLVTS